MLAENKICDKVRTFPAVIFFRRKGIMKKLIWIVALVGCFLPLNMMAQVLSKGAPAKISWGQEYSEAGSTVIQKTIEDGEHIFAIRERATGTMFNVDTKKIYLERYDKNLRLKKSKEYKLKYKGKNLEFEDLIRLGGNLYLLTSYHNKSKKINYLFYQQINKRSLNINKKYTKISDIPTRSQNRDGFFDLHISRDSSKLLIYSKLPYKKGTPERFDLQVYNNQFELLWDKEIALPYDDENFTVEEYRVDNKGNVYLLGVNSRDRLRSRYRGAPTYQYTILAYTEGGTDFEEYPIKFRDKFITDLTFRVADDGNLVCSGFYSERNSSGVRGTYFFRLDAETKKVYNKNLHEFEFNFRSEDLSNRRRAKAAKAESRGDDEKGAELTNYELDRLILRSDGGALLIAEQYDEFQRQAGIDYYTRMYGNNNLMQQVFIYDDIIVVNIRPNGEIEWSARIPKHQMTIDDNGYFSSYAMTIVRDRLFFIYNDNARNYRSDRKSNRWYSYNGSNSIIVLAEVRRDGQVNTYPLFNNEDLDIISRPKVSKQIGRQEMLVYGERGRRYRFGSITFD